MLHIKKGEQVVVRHSIHWQRGTPITVGASKIVQTVDQVYMDDKIRTSSGDVWDVTRIGGTLYTVAPNKVKAKEAN